MGEAHESSPSESCCVLRTRERRRNAMWNIFEGVEEAVLQNLAGLTLDMVQELVTESTDDSFAQYLSQLPTPTSSQSSASSSCSSAASSSSSLDGSLWYERARVQRSFSTTTAGEEIQAALQSRGRRRNAVGNLFDLLTPSQKLLLVEHLQEQVGRLQGWCGDVSADHSNSSSSHVILSLADLSSASSPAGSSSGSSNGSSPRSQGEIVCR